MNEIEKRLAEELGFRVYLETCTLTGDAPGSMLEPTIELPLVRDGNYMQLGSPRELALWRKCCELMGERNALAEAHGTLNARLSNLESRAISLGYTRDQRDKLFGESK